jgi:uncharacterized protein YjdB
MKRFYLSSLFILTTILLVSNANIFAQTTTTFSTAGGPYSYVATGSYVIATVIAGKGGDNNQYPSGGSWPAHGGYGGQVVCTLATTPGVTYYVYVGGQGGKGSASAGSTGGINGGGTGGYYCCSYGGGGGGGESDIRLTSGVLSSRLVVAGGGGGAGLDCTGYCNGGNGGGTTAQNGEGCDNGYSYPDGGNGQGGSTSAGLGGATGGGNGALGIGGNGVTSTPAGGGGAGYYGGGGSGYWFGGGGGSSYTDPVLATAVTHTPGANSTGDGSVVIFSPCSAGIISGSQKTCPGLTTALTDATTGGTWTSSNTSVATVTSSGLVSGLTAGTTTISYGGTLGCGVAYSFVTVTVNPTPSSITGSTNVCIGLTSTLSDATVPGGWTSATTTIAKIDNFTGVLTGVSSGTSTITYTATTGCFITTVANVNPLPSSISGGVPQTVCSGLTNTLIDGGGGTWTSSNPGLASITLGPVGGGVATGVVAGTPVITYTLPSGCFTTTTLTVLSGPAAITGVAQVCFGSTTTLNDASSGGAWTSSTSSVATVGTGGIVTGVAASGVATINYTFGNGCAQTKAVTVNALPTLYILSSLTGSAYCAGSTPPDLVLNSSTVGVNYQLTNSGSPVGSPLAGTGAPLDFGPQGAPGTYQVTATNGTTFCSRTMVGSVAVSINPLPPVSTLTVTNGGNFCAGSAGVDIYDSLSTSGIQYQLFNGAVPLFTPIPGTTGAKLDFGAVYGVLFNTPGTYTAVAQNTVTGCLAKVSNAITVTSNALPSVFDVTGGGDYCAGGSGVHVGLSYSNTGINYQLWNGAILVTTVLGSNSGLDFGVQPTGTYTVVAVNAATGCTANMNGSATVIANLPPNIYILSTPGSSTYCTGSAGVHFVTNGSDVGVDYYLYNGGVAVPGAVFSGTGSNLDLGFFTAAGTYTLIGVSTSTSCTQNMGGSITVATYPLMVQYTLSASVSSYCTGAAGADLTLNGSTSGIQYTLYRDGVALPAPGVQIGGGSTVDFSTWTASGGSTSTFTAVAMNSLTTCTLTMLGTPSVTENTLPVIYTLTGGGGYCAGTSGVNIGLSFSDPGISYQLWRGGVKVGSAIMGSSSALDFGTFTTTGTYTIVATNTLTGCSSNMTGSTVVSVNSLPVVYAVSGGGSYCAGGLGKDVMLANSSVGVNYQLFYNGTPLGGAATGTGGPIDFGTQPGLGMYTVVGTDGGTSCSSNMSGNAVITTNPLPAVFGVTGGGTYCTGGTGMHVGLNGSTPGITYQLYNGGPVGAAMTGTGAPLDFGLQTASGTYTVIAGNPVTGCSSNMSGSVAIIVGTLPNVYSVTLGGSYCAGGAGAHIGLSGSDAGVSYQMFVAGMPVGSPVTGTGVALDFGLQTNAGAYTVVATNSATSCTMNMSGSQSVNINPLPSAYTITGGGHYCASGAGIDINLSGSHTGVSYQLYVGGTAVGSPMTGTGTGLDFGLQTGAGVYTAIATNTTTGCVNNMASSGTISIDPAPLAFAIGGGGHYCAGGTGVPMNISGSEPGVNYQLFVGSTPSGLPVGGTGTIVNFNLQTVGGVYTVIGTNNTTKCSGNMTGTETVTVDPVVTPSVAISASNGTSTCVGMLDVFTAMPTNGGATPTYLWSVNGLVSGSSNTFSYIPSDGDIIGVAMTSTATCLTSPSSLNAVTMNVLPYKMPTATVVSVPGVNVCQGTPVTFTATSTFGGSAAGNLWLNNSKLVGTGNTFSYTPTSANNGDVIEFMLISSYLCRLADTVFSPAQVMNIDVNAVPSFTLASHLGPKIGVGQVDTFVATATPVAGSVFSYQWQLGNTVIPGETSPMYIDRSVFNGDHVSCVVTREGACGTQSASKSATVSLSDVGVKPVATVGTDIAVLPNPNKGEFTVKGTLGTTADEEVSLEITDMIGQVVYNHKVVAQNGNINERIQLGKNMANGMYILNLRSAGANNVYHIVVEQ